MNALQKDFSAAYGDFWNIVGFLTSGVAIFNFLARTFQIDPSPLLQRLLGAFRFVFHPVINFFFGWLPFDLTPEAKDGLTLYFVVGGAVARTFLALTRAVGVQRVHAAGDPFMDWFVGSALRRSVGLAAGVLFWPIMLVVFWQRPIVVQFPSMANPETRYRHRNPFQRILRRRFASELPEVKKAGSYSRDLRRVFFLQLLAALAVVLVMSLDAAGIYSQRQF